MRLAALASVRRRPGSRALRPQTTPLRRVAPTHRPLTPLQAFHRTLAPAQERPWPWRLPLLCSGLRRWPSPSRFHRCGLAGQSHGLRTARALAREQHLPTAIRWRSWRLRQRQAVRQRRQRQLRRRRSPLQRCWRSATGCSRTPVRWLAPEHAVLRAPSDMHPALAGRPPGLGAVVCKARGPHCGWRRRHSGRRQHRRRSHGRRLHGSRGT